MSIEQDLQNGKTITGKYPDNLMWVIQAASKVLWDLTPPEEKQEEHWEIAVIIKQATKGEMEFQVAITKIHEVPNEV